MPHLHLAGSLRLKIMIPICSIVFLQPVAFATEPLVHNQCEPLYREAERRLHAEETVTLHRTRGSVVVGSFRGFDYGTNELLLRPLLGRDYAVMGYDLDLVDRVTYQRKAQVVDEAIFGGLIIGGLLGALIGYAVELDGNSSPSYYDYYAQSSDDGSATVTGALIGALIGATAGTVIPMLLPRTFEIEF